jgi:putative NADPH-quinone reductase
LKRVKVLALNASPKLDRGNTALILTPFLDGMRKAGADVELVYVSRLAIRPCHGEQGCWFRTPGTCIQGDDMRTLLARLRAADLWVWGTPLYCEGLPGTMKIVVDRMLPLLEPFVELRAGRCTVVRRDTGRLALIATCGFWGIESFDRLVAQVQAICDLLGRALVGALLRPHAGVYAGMLQTGAPVGDVGEAACAAGRQLVLEGRMDPLTVETVGRPLLPVEAFVSLANQGARQALTALGA